MSVFTDKIKELCSDAQGNAQYGYLYIDGAIGWDKVEELATEDLRIENREISKTNDPDMAQELQTVRDANLYLQGEITDLTTERDQLLKERDMLMTKVRDDGNG